MFSSLPLSMFRIAQHLVALSLVLGVLALCILSMKSLTLLFGFKNFLVSQSVYRIAFFCSRYNKPRVYVSFDQNAFVVRMVRDHDRSKKGTFGDTCIHVGSESESQ